MEVSRVCVDALGTIPRDAVHAQSDGPLLEDWDRPLAESQGLGARPLDLPQTDNGVINRATLAGAKPEDIDISVTGDELTFRGDVKSERQDESAHYHARELRHASCSRSIALPAPAVAGKAGIRFQDAVLTPTPPKAKAVMPKIIAFKPR